MVAISGLLAAAGTLIGGVGTIINSLSQSSSPPTRIPTPTSQSSSQLEAIPSISASSDPGETGLTPGTLIARASLIIPAEHGIIFGPAPIIPRLSVGDLGFDFDDSRMLTTSGIGQFAAFPGVEPGYHSCLGDRLYIRTFYSYSYAAGTKLCFTGHGVVAAVIITGREINDHSAIAQIIVDVIVWKGS